MKRHLSYLTTLKVLVLCSFACFSILAFAQPSNLVSSNPPAIASNLPPITNAVPATNAPAGGPVAIPTAGVDYWTLAIAAVAPLIVGGIKKLAPKIPTWLLPTSTPVIGILLGAILNYFGAHHFSWFDAAKAGALAVFIRETWNQTITQGLMGRDGGTITPPTPPTTPGPASTQLGR